MNPRSKPAFHEIGSPDFVFHINCRKVVCTKWAQSAATNKEMQLTQPSNHALEILLSTWGCLGSLISQGVQACIREGAEPHQTEPPQP